MDDLFQGQVRHIHHRFLASLLASVSDVSVCEHPWLMNVVLAGVVNILMDSRMFDSFSFKSSEDH